MMSTQGAIIEIDAPRLMESLGLSKNEARSEVQLLLGFSQQKSRSHVVAFPERPVDAENYGKYHVLLQRRLSGEPMAYIFGHKEFYGMNFAVNPNVLIPRPETELLVERALTRIAHDAACRVLDLGTGSGNVALVLASERPLSRVTAVDISQGALETATKNAHDLRVHNVTFVESDWYAAMNEEIFDVIVANPPYVADNDPHLQLGDVRFEPKNALLGGEHGIAHIHEIAVNSRNHLSNGGWLLIEHGYNQSHMSHIELKNAGFDKITTYDDLGGTPRITEGHYGANKPVEQAKPV
jgi:release factor glutamine methyltransferase